MQKNLTYMAILMAFSAFSLVRAFEPGPSTAEDVREIHRLLAGFDQRLTRIEQKLGIESTVQPKSQSTVSQALGAISELLGMKSNNQPQSQKAIEAAAADWLRSHSHAKID